MAQIAKSTKSTQKKEAFQKVSSWSETTTINDLPQAAVVYVKVISAAVADVPLGYASVMAADILPLKAPQISEVWHATNSKRRLPSTKPNT